jgi:hypothetical protein
MCRTSQSGLFQGFLYEFIEQVLAYKLKIKKVLSCLSNYQPTLLCASLLISVFLAKDKLHHQEFI